MHIQKYLRVCEELQNAVLGMLFCTQEPAVSDDVLAIPLEIICLAGGGVSCCSSTAGIGLCQCIHFPSQQYCISRQGIKAKG